MASSSTKPRMATGTLLRRCRKTGRVNRVRTNNAHCTLSLKAINSADRTAEWDQGRRWDISSSLGILTGSQATANNSP